MTHDKERLIGMVNFLLVITAVLGGLAAGMFIIGGGWAIVGWPVVAVWAFLFWRWVLNMRSLRRGEW